MGDQWVFVVEYNYGLMDFNIFDVFQFILVIILVGFQKFPSFASESLFLFAEFFDYNPSGFW